MLLFLIIIATWQHRANLQGTIFVSLALVGVCLNYCAFRVRRFQEDRDIWKRLSPEPRFMEWFFYSVFQLVQGLTSTY